MPNKHALLIGINQYPFMEEQYQLSGCVNDVKLLRQVLVQKFGFNRDNIRTLFNKDATRQGMLDAMNDIVSVLEEDDIFVFQYSGHGHQCRVKTEFTDEGSGKLNCILPCDDSEPKPDSDDVFFREIREHEINEWLHKIAEKTRYTTLIFDACHSGTITRNVIDGDNETRQSRQYKARFIPESARNQVVTLDSEASDIVTRSGQAVDNKATNWLTLSENYVVISGCRDTQKSKETYFYEGDARFKHGVMTYCLCEALKNAKPGMTYRDVFEQVSARVVTIVQEQNPQIEGELDREVLGVHDIEPLNFILVDTVSDNTVTLSAGVAQGVSINSEWDIYLPHSKREDASAIVAKIKVTTATGLTATGDIIECKAPIDVGARAVLRHNGEVAKPLSVNLSELPSSIKPALERDVHQSTLLRAEESRNKSDMIGFSYASLQTLPTSFQPAVSQGSNFPVAGFMTKEGSLAMPIQGLNLPNVDEILMDNLEKIAKYRNLLNLRNNESELDVEFNLYRRLIDDNVELVNGGTSEFMDSEPMVIEFRNNMPETTVFFNVIWLTANCEVMHFYPPRTSSEELSPGRVVRIGDQLNKLSASLSKNYYADLGMESIKVFFSTAETDFRFLNQSGLRSSGPVQTTGNVIKEFQSAVTGKAPEKSTTVVDDWQAVTRSFLLHRTMR